VNGTGYEQFFMLKGAPVFPAPSGRLYVRVYIRLKLAMTEGHNTYFEASLDGMGDPPFEARVGVQFSALAINQPGNAGERNLYPDPQQKAAVQFAAGAWNCVEVLFDSPNTTLDTWVNGQEIPSLHATDWKIEAFNVLRFGFEQYQGPATELWYDDIAVGTQKIGCN
jgi:hypothetical protein